MKYILALDQGTTSSRAIVFNRSGSIAAMAQKEFKQHFPHPAWVEHDPNEIWSSQAAVATEALAQGGLSPGQIAAIGITNQRETTIVWDRDTGEPIYNAIVWQDRRTAPLCERLKKKGYEPLIRKKTGLLLDPYFSATKLHWILNHVPGAKEKARKGRLAFGTVDSWLVWKLTSGQYHITDATNASRTLLFNIHTGSWDPELLRLFSIPASMLPEVRSCSEIYTHTNFFSPPIPIAGIAGDQHAALFGQACTRAGMVKNTYGTGCFLLMHTGDRPKPSTNLLTTIAWNLDGKTEYALEGSMFIAGAAIQWLRDNLGIISSLNEVEKLAVQTQDSGGVFFVPAFAGLGAPYWDPHARGLITGITRGTGAAHICRAALESIAFQVADLLDVMQSDSRIRLKELRVDGGGSTNNLLMQIQANLLGVPVVRTKTAETTALGAAYLAGLASGFWKNRAQIAAQWKADRQFRPALAANKRKQLRAGWQQAMVKARTTREF